MTMTQPNNELMRYLKNALRNDSDPRVREFLAELESNRNITDLECIAAIQRFFRTRQQQAAINTILQHFRSIDQAYLEQSRAELLQGFRESLSTSVYQYVRSFFGRQQPRRAQLREEGLNLLALRNKNYTGLIREEFICPLSRMIMDDPVYVRQHPEHRFERAWILAHLENHANNPLTRERLTPVDLIADDEMRTRIEAFVANPSNEPSQQTPGSSLG